jgi:hypothetical protein
VFLAQLQVGQQGSNLSWLGAVAFMLFSIVGLWFFIRAQTRYYSVYNRSARARTNGPKLRSHGPWGVLIPRSLSDSRSVTFDEQEDQGVEAARQDYKRKTFIAIGLAFLGMVVFGVLSQVYV